MNKHFLLFGSKSSAVAGLVAWFLLAGICLFLLLFSGIQYVEEPIGKIAQWVNPSIAAGMALLSLFLLRDICRGRKITFAIDVGNIFWKIAVMGFVICMIAFLMT
jgi:hypothetical protein